MDGRLIRWRSFLFGLAALVALVVGHAQFHAAPVAAARAEAARGLAVVDPAEVGVSAKRLERLDAGMQAMVDDGKLAGIVTMLARHGKVVFTDTVGKLDVGKDAPVELDSIFRIFSMTKPVVGTALMMLHEEGRWQLDDPVSKFIPAYGRHRVPRAPRQDAPAGRAVHAGSRRHAPGPAGGRPGAGRAREGTVGRRRAVRYCARLHPIRPDAAERR